jgi:quinol monooxygenase YgiN
MKRRRLFGKNSRSNAGLFVCVIIANLGLAQAALCDAEEVKPAQEQFVVSSRIYPAIGREDEVQARLIQETQLAKKLGSQIVFRLHRSVNEPVFFVFYQIYPSQAAFDRRHVAIMRTIHKELGPLPEGMLARLSDIEYFHTLAD